MSTPPRVTIIREVTGHTCLPSSGLALHFFPGDVLDVVAVEDAADPSLVRCISSFRPALLLPRDAIRVE